MQTVVVNVVIADVSFNAYPVWRERDVFNRSAVPLERLLQRARAGVPDPHRSIPRPRREPPAVGREGDGRDAVAVPLERLLQRRPV